jgi:phage terminase large subunit-like protein
MPDSLSFSEKRALADLLTEKARRKARRRLYDLYPDEGPLRRELYRKHMQFFRLGAEPGVNERAFMAANRVGKTWGAGGYETALHLTGRYPDWWAGRRHSHPVDWWAAGDTSETTRDIIQFCLLGPVEEIGSGLIPGEDLVGEPSRKRGVADAIDTVAVRHVSGGVSTLGFKSYDQGRKKFQGTAKHGCWLDEEPDQDVYSECLLRLMTTSGMMLLTFTPLSGVSEVVLQFMDGNDLASLGNGDMGRRSASDEEPEGRAQRISKAA